MEFDAFSGSSGGSIAAAFLASGKEPKEVLEIIKEIDFKKIVKFNYFRNSIFSMKKAQEFFKEQGLIDFDKLQKKLFVCVTDFETYETLYIDKGDLSKFLVASSSLIPIFEPFEIDGKKYIDGGFTDNLPITPLLDFDFKLAINVNPPINLKESFLNNLYMAGFIMLNNNIKFSKDKADRFVEITECKRFSIFDRKNFDLLYQIGEESAKREELFWQSLMDGES